MDLFSKIFTKIKILDNNRLIEEKQLKMNQQEHMKYIENLR